MKILYLGHTEAHTSDKYRFKGMTKYGLDVWLLDYRKIYKRTGLSGLFENLLHAIYSYQPDAVLVNKGEKFIPEIIKKLKDIFPHVLWLIFYGDVRSEIASFLKRNLHCFDALLINANDKRYWETFKRYGIKRIFFHHTATDLDVFRKHKKIKEIYDIGFFGGNYGQLFPNAKFREKIMHILMKRYKVLIHGIGWVGGKKRVYGENFSKQASKCKLLLGISNFDNLNEYTSNRTWNSIACGTVIHHKFKGIENLFENKKHLIWFDNVKDLNKKIDYYLKHPKKRKKIYSDGRKFLEEEHTYKKRAEELHNIVNQLRRQA